MQNRYVWLYIGLAFGIAWITWVASWALSINGIAVQHLVSIVIAGSFGPFLAAGLCAALRDGWRGMLRFYARAFHWRMSAFAFIVSVALIPVLAILTAGLFQEHGVLPKFNLSWADLPETYLWLLVLGGPVAEEFGWSFLSDGLDEIFGFQFSTLSVGAIWALWHLPLFFLAVPGLEQRFIPFYEFAFVAVSWRFLFSWAYHRSGRSILSNLLMHNGVNLGLTVVLIVIPVTGNPQLRLWVFGSLTALSALILWLAIPPARRGHQNRIFN